MASWNRQFRLLLPLLIVSALTVEAIDVSRRHRSRRAQQDTVNTAIITDGAGDSGGEFEDSASSPQTPPQQPPPSGTVYLVILDAGSSGTRALAYQFRVNRSNPIGLDYVSVYKRKSDLGLSNFERNPPRCRQMLEKLLGEVAEGIPQAIHAETSAILRATAGFRLMKAHARVQVAKEARAALRRSVFRVPTDDAELVRMLSGSDEAKYSWIAVNFLLGSFQHVGAVTKPIVEVGGGSLQVAFEEPAGKAIFQLRGGRYYRVHTHSYLGLGFKESVLRIIGYQADEASVADARPAMTQISTPCIAPSLALNFSFGSADVRLLGEAGVADERRVNVCSDLARRLVRQLEVHDEVDLARGGSHWPLYGIGSVYFLVQFLHQNGLAPNIRPDDATCRAAVSRGLRCNAFTGTVGDLAGAVRRVCSDPPRSDRFSPYYCISTAVISALLSHGLRLPEAAEFSALGNSDALGWSLGLGLEYLSSGPTAVSSAGPHLSTVTLAFTAMQLLRILS